MSDTVSNATILAAITAGNDALTKAATERGQLRIDLASQAKDVEHLQTQMADRKSADAAMTAAIDALKTRVDRLLAGIVVVVAVFEIAARWIPNPWGP